MNSGLQWPSSMDVYSIPVVVLNIHTNIVEYPLYHGKEEGKERSPFRTLIYEQDSSREPVTMLEFKERALGGLYREMK